MVKSSFVAWVLRLMVIAALAILLPPVILVGQQPTAQAKPVKVWGDCKRELNKWRKRGGYGAFAAARSGACGLSWDSGSIEAARSAALTLCRKQRGAKDCQIIETITKPGKLIVETEKCWSAKNLLTADLRIAACTGLILSGRDKGRNLAWDYNSRGIAYLDKGQRELGLADYAEAIKIHKAFPWPYLNLARIRRDEGKHAEALALIKNAVKYFDKKKESAGLAEAKVILAELETKLAVVSALKDAELCRKALTSDKSRLDASSHYAVYVDELKRKKLEVGDCRVMLGFPRKVGAYEGHSAENLCKAALNSAKTDWLARDVASGQRDEVDRRKYTVASCRSTLGLLAEPPAAAPPTDAFANDPLPVVCRLALNADRDDWDTRAVFKDRVAAAKKRGLTVRYCTALLGPPPQRIRLAEKKATDQQDSDMDGLYKLIAGAPENATILPAQPDENPTQAAAGKVAMGEPSPQSEPLAAIPKTSSRRFALVVGNGKYTSLPNLSSPENDVTLVADALTRVGFTIIMLKNANAVDLNSALRNFAAMMRDPPAAGFIYFAGHGVQVEGKNYILPSDADVRKQQDLKWQAISVDDVLTTFNPHVDTSRFLVLDASWYSPLPGVLPAARPGLAPLVAPPGTVVAFSVAPNVNSPHGGNGTSPYAKAFVEAIASSGLTPEEAFKRMRIKLIKAHGEKAATWESNALLNDFKFLR